MENPFNDRSFLFIVTFLCSYFHATNFQFITSYKTNLDPYFGQANIPWQSVVPVNKSLSFGTTALTQFYPPSTIHYLPLKPDSLTTLKASFRLVTNYPFTWKDVNSKKYEQMYSFDNKVYTYKEKEAIFEKISTSLLDSSKIVVSQTRNNISSGIFTISSAPQSYTNPDKNITLSKNDVIVKKNEKLFPIDNKLHKSPVTPVDKSVPITFSQSKNYHPSEKYSLTSSKQHPANKLAQRTIFTWEDFNTAKYESSLPVDNNFYNGNATKPTFFSNVPSKIRPTPSTITFSPSKIYLPSRTYSLISLTSSFLPQVSNNRLGHNNTFTWEDVNKIVYKQSFQVHNNFSYYGNTDYFHPYYEDFPKYYHDPLNKVTIFNYDNIISNNVLGDYDTKHDYYDQNHISYHDLENEYTHNNELYDKPISNQSFSEVIQQKENETRVGDLDDIESTQHFLNLTQDVKLKPLNFITKIRKLFPLPQGSFMSLNFKLVLPLSTVPSTSAWTLIGDYRFSVVVSLPRYIPGRHREKRSATAYDRALIYSLFSDFLSKLGFDGNACLLRSVCEAGEDPIQDYGTLGELFNFILSPGYFHDDIHYEYTEAEKYGILYGGCSEKFHGCPVSLREILHSGISSLASMPF